MQVRRIAAIAAALGAIGCSASTTGSSNMNNNSTGSSASIGIQNFSFSPKLDTVKVGTKVTWTNNDNITHASVSDQGVWDSGAINPASGGTYGGGGAAGSYSYTFATAGTYTYHCSYHPPSVYPNFTGTVVVIP